MNDEIQEVKELEMELLQPETRKSAKRLDELLADDFFEYMSRGTATNKKEVLNRLPNSPEEEFKAREMQAKVLSDDIILLNYITHRKVISSGEQKCTLCSSIWRRENEKWQMVFFQGTPAGSK